MPKIVITGGLGHIGSRLIRSLPDLVSDLEVVIVDNLATQRYPSLFDLPAEGRFRFMNVDVTASDLDPWLENAACLVHLAALTDATASFQNKGEVERVNFGGSERVARSCARLGVRMIVASSTSVYGSQEAVVDENCGPADLKPQSPYAESKLREEALFADLVASQGLRGVVFRFGTIFGTSPGMRFHTAVNKFCWQAVMGEPLTVWSTAYDQRRPYLDVRDAVRAVAFFLNGDLFDQRIYNVVTGNHTVRDVVDAIRHHVPDLAVTFVNQPIMNQLSYDVRNSRLIERGFTFEGDLKRGVAETIALLQRMNGGAALCA